MSQRSCDLALRYADELGFALLPLQPRGKEPHFRLLKAVHGTPSWSRLREQRASADDVREWFRLDPKANVGIITGRASGDLVVLDFDRRPNLRMGETAIARTGRGMHVYLHSDVLSVRPHLNRFEIKGEGSYVVAPPSIHGSETPYSWMIAPSGFGNVFLPEATLADFSHYQLGQAESLIRGRPRSTGTEMYMYTCVPLTPNSQLEDWDKSLEFAAAFARLVGIPFKGLGKPFRCVLPGHAESRPSAALIRESQHGTIVYHDLHRASGHPVFTLTDVYVAVTTKLITKLSGPEHAVWKQQLLIDLGLREPYPIQIEPLPLGSPANAIRWYDGLGRLYAARGEGWIESGVPLTASFAKKWCGLSTNQATKGKGWLIQHGFIQQVGRHGLMKLWRPAGFDAVTTASSGGGIRLQTTSQDRSANGEGQ